MGLEGPASGCLPGASTMVGRSLRARCNVCTLALSPAFSPRSSAITFDLFATETDERGEVDAMRCRAVT